MNLRKAPKNVIVGPLLCKILISIFMLSITSRILSSMIPIKREGVGLETYLRRFQGSTPSLLISLHHPFPLIHRHYHQPPFPHLSRRAVPAWTAYIFMGIYLFTKLHPQYIFFKLLNVGISTTKMSYFSINADSHYIQHGYTSSIQPRIW